MQNSYGLVAITPAPVLPMSVLPVGKEWETAMQSFSRGPVEQKDLAHSAFLCG